MEQSGGGVVERRVVFEAQARRSGRKHLREADSGDAARVDLFPAALFLDSGGSRFDLAHGKVAPVQVDIIGMACEGDVDFGPSGKSLLRRVESQVQPIGARHDAVVELAQRHWRRRPCRPRGDGCLWIVRPRPAGNRNQQQRGEDEKTRRIHSSSASARRSGCARSDRRTGRPGWWQSSRRPKSPRCASGWSASLRPVTAAAAIVAAEPIAALVAALPALPTMPFPRCRCSCARACRLPRRPFPPLPGPSAAASAAFFASTSSALSRLTRVSYLPASGLTDWIIARSWSVTGPRRAARRLDQRALDHARRAVFVSSVETSASPTLSSVIACLDVEVGIDAEGLAPPP